MSDGKQPERLGRSDLFRICVVAGCVATAMCCAVCATILGVNGIDPPPGLVAVASLSMGVVAGMLSK